MWVAGLKLVSVPVRGMRDLYEKISTILKWYERFRPRQGNEGFVLEASTSDAKEQGFRPRQGNEGFVYINGSGKTGAG